MINSIKTENRTLKIVLMAVVVFLFSVFYFLGSTPVHAGVISMPPNNLGLVGYWSFEDINGTGATTTDFSGNGNDGLLKGDADQAPGKRGKGMILDGTSDRIDLGSGSTISTLTNVTVSSWVKVDIHSTYEVAVSNTRDCCNSSGGGYNLYARYVNGGPKFQIRNEGVSNEAKSSESLDEGRWYFLTGTYDGSDLKMYVDGELKKTTSYSGGFPAFDYSTKIGSLGSSYSQGLDGQVDEVRIYNRALSASEVEDLYQSGSVRVNSSTKGQFDENLISHWTFDPVDMDFSSLDALDATGLNDANIVGPVASIGKLGQALVFDGTDDYLCLDSASGTCTGSDSNSTFDDAFDTRTWSVWFKVDDATATQMIFQEGGASNGANIYVSGGSLYAGAWSVSTGWSGNFTSTAITDGDWHHVMMVFDGNTEHTTYLNGTFVETVVPSAEMNAHSGDDSIGATRNNTKIHSGDIFSTGTHYFGGVIDDFRVYSTALDASDATALFNLGQSTINKTSDTGVKKSNLVAHWTFDGPSVSGSTITDVTGNGNTGTASGTDQPGIGKVGQGYDFTGAGNDAVTFSSIAFSGSATISAWVKPDDLSVDGAFRTIIGNSGGDRIYISSSGGLSIRQNASNLSLSPSGVVSVGEWAHVVVTWDGSTATGYINGVVTSPTRSVASITNYNRIGIISASGEWDGAIDDVRIYNTALSASEIQQLYQVGL